MIEYKETYRSLASKSSSDIALYSAGTEACKPGHFYGPTVRPYHLIHFVRSGSGVLRIAGKELHPEAGCAFIIPAGSISYYQASEEDPWDYAWVGFLGISARSYIQHMPGDSPDPYLLQGIDVERCFEAIERIVAMDASPQVGFLRSNGILLELLSYLAEDTGLDARSSEHEGAVGAARLIIEMEFSDHLLVSEVARRVGVHPNYLSKLFKDAYGQTPKRFLTTLRLSRAKKLLEETDESIRTVAASVGFDDQLAFAKAFRHEYEMTPTEYRRSRLHK